jgi:hypothetical protein
MIRGAFEAALRALNYSYEAPRGPSDLRFEIGTPDGSTYRAQLLIDEAHHVTQYYVHLDLTYPPAKRVWVVELVMRINSELVIGGFEFDWDSGSIAFKVGLHFRTELVATDDASGILGLAAFPLSLFKRAYARRNGRNVSPKAAIEAARVLEGIAQSPALSNAGRRAMLHLVCEA